MKFKKLLSKIHEQSGSGNAVNVLRDVEIRKTRTKRYSPNTLPYSAKNNMRAISRPLY
jgi:hypothetical protein